jgi:hypothetical protein
MIVKCNRLVVLFNNNLIVYVNRIKIIELINIILDRCLEISIKKKLNRNMIVKLNRNKLIKSMQKLKDNIWILKIREGFMIWVECIIGEHLKQVSNNTIL